mgnify:CR=1 FL=1
MHTKLPGKSLNPKHFFGKKREDVQTNKKKNATIGKIIIKRKINDFPV